MGRLYSGCQQVLQEIDRQGLDLFKTRGALALETGFLVSMVEPGDPDDEARIELLRKAAKDVLGLTLSV